MIPLLAGGIPWRLIGLAALALAIGGLWLRGDYLAHQRDKARAEVAAVTSERDQAVAANRSAIQAIDELRAEAERATAARKSVADKLHTTETRLAAARKAIDHAKPNSCPLPDAIGLALDGLRRPAPAGGGDADKSGAGQPAGRTP